LTASASFDLRHCPGTSLIIRDIGLPRRASLAAVARDLAIDELTTLTRIKQSCRRGALFEISSDAFLQHCDTLSQCGALTLFGHPTFHSSIVPPLRGSGRERAGSSVSFPGSASPRFRMA
jgi:hypothetical protein